MDRRGLSAFRLLALAYCVALVGCTEIVPIPGYGLDTKDASGEVDILADAGDEAEDVASDGVDAVAPDIPPFDGDSDVAHADQSDLDDLVAHCEPDCPAGFACDADLCHDPTAVPGTCGWYVPGTWPHGEMCRIASGAAFVLGCDEADAPCDAASQPRVSVALSGTTWVDRYEVTNERYEAYLSAMTALPVPTCDWGADLWSLDGRSVTDAWRRPHPVVCVDADEALGYCDWAGGKTLPTEAQWEAAARGTDSFTFPWGEGWSDWDAGAAQCYRNPTAGAEDYAKQCDNEGYYTGACGADNPTSTCVTSGTAPVVLLTGACSRPGESPIGLCHAAGNVAEWVRDGWSDDHSAMNEGAIGACAQPSSGLCVDPFVPIGEGGGRVVKGGSYEDQKAGLTTWGRKPIPSPDKPTQKRLRWLGFRCAWVPGVP